MCTVTWWSRRDCYELFFSRDELKSRQAGLPPRLCEQEGVHYLCPIDADAGGTWLLVNEYGMSIGLLNQYPEYAKDILAPVISRGLLLKALANCSSVGQVKERLRATDLRHYAPFMMVVLELNSQGTVFHWDSLRLEIDEQARSKLPLTSSSYDSYEVVRRRRHCFAEMLAEGSDPSSEELDAFHRQHSVDAGAYSVFMQRDDAETVSISQVVVQAGKIQLFYKQKLPEQQAFSKAQVASLKGLLINQ